jgi:hypothetical protein
MTTLNIPVTPTPEVSSRTLSLVMFSGRARLIVLFGFMMVAALHPTVRSSMRSSIVKDFRVVVSTAHGDLLGNGSEMTIAKVRTRDSLFLEIYEPKDDGSQRLVERIEMPDHKDGYFNFNGQAMNLAIDDIDGDGRLDILAPSFDQNLVGHLNIYRFDQSSGVFQRSLR